MGGGWEEGVKINIVRLKIKSLMRMCQMVQEILCIQETITLIQCYH